MTNDERPLIRSTSSSLHPTQAYEWSDCLFCGCAGKLSVEQKNALDVLKQKCTESHMFDDAYRAKLLQKYYTSIFPTKPQPPMEGPEWKTIGFQCNVPTRDLRTGIFPLENMVFLTETYTDEAQSMVREAAEDNYYPFSATCINVVQLLVAFFMLQSKSMSPIGLTAPRGNVEEVKAFASMCVVETPEKAFGELFAACVFRVHKEWIDISKRGGNLLQFRQCLEATLCALQEGLSDAATIDEITSYMRVGVQLESDLENRNISGLGEAAYDKRHKLVK